MNRQEIITRADTIVEALRRFDMTGGRLLVLVDDSGAFERVLSQGDVRRLLLDGAQVDDTLLTLPLATSVYVHEDATFNEIEKLFSETRVDQMPVLDHARRPVGLLEACDYRPILLSTPHLGEDELKFVNEAFDTNWIAPVGPNLDAFEQGLAELTGVPNVVALSSGTAAIHLALIVLGVEAGDTVLCSSLTFAASANPIRYQGAEPVFVDSEPDTWNMSPEALGVAIENCLSRGRLPKAAIVVDLYGQSADMEAIQSICARHNIPIVEDAAESLGATYKGKQSGTFGTIGIFSFNGNKIITTSGGGALLSHDAALVERARYYATQARQPVLHYEHTEVGYNYRMSNVLAGIGRGQLSVLDDRIARRRAVFDNYREHLAGIEGISFMPEPEGYRSNRWLTAMLVSEKSSGTARGLIEFLANGGVEARPVWKPMHLQPVYKDYPYFAHGHNRSVSDTLFEQGVCLPSGTNNTDKDIARVVELISAYFKG